jgi:hypothetical protein
MRSILLPLAVILTRSFLVLYGALLASNPAAFLRFHDTFVDRSKLNRSAAWRRNVYNRDYRILGIVFLVVGLLIVLAMVTKLASRPL